MNGFISGKICMPFKSQADQFVDNNRKRLARTGPHFWVAGRIGQAGHRVYLIYEQRSGIVSQEKIDTREARRVNRLKRRKSHLTNFIGKLVRDRCRHDEFVVACAGVFFGVVEKLLFLIPDDVLARQAGFGIVVAENGALDLAHVQPFLDDNFSVVNGGEIDGFF